MEYSRRRRPQTDLTDDACCRFVDILGCLRKVENGKRMENEMKNGETERRRGREKERERENELMFLIFIFGVNENEIKLNVMPTSSGDGGGGGDAVLFFFFILTSCDRNRESCYLTLTTRKKIICWLNFLQVPIVCQRSFLECRWPTVFPFGHKSNKNIFINFFRHTHTRRRIKISPNPVKRYIDVSPCIGWRPQSVVVHRKEIKFNHFKIVP